MGRKAQQSQGDFYEAENKENANAAKKNNNMRKKDNQQEGTVQTDLNDSETGSVDITGDEACDSEIQNNDINREDTLKELGCVKKELEEKSKQCADYLDKLQRTAAEYDNFKKRSAKEKKALYSEAVCDVVSAFIPVLDNIERALQAMPADDSAKTLKDGVEMVFKQFMEVLKNIGVEEIKAVNEQFDPMLHNAVMHVEDEALGQNTIVEQFQKGYKCKDRVIRYSMVKVAN